MSFGDLFAMPADEAELSAMMAYAYRRGRAGLERSQGVRPPERPLTVSCEDHDSVGPKSACLACIEASSYCPHGQLLTHHFGAERTDWCWRPRYRDEAERPEEHESFTELRCDPELGPHPRHTWSHRRGPCGGHVCPGERMRPASCA